MIIAKFGGTSLANQQRMKVALNIVGEHLNASEGNKKSVGCVLVASASGKTTDAIYSLIEYAKQQQEKKLHTAFNELKKHHSAIWHHDRLSIAQRAVGETIEKLCNSLWNVLIELSNNSDAKQEPWLTARALSFGELLSTHCLQVLCYQLKLQHILLDSRELIRTDDNPLSAEVEWDTTRKAIRDAIDKKAHTLFIAQGFIASNQQGATTTFSRGGSDYTASLYAAALQAQRVEIWTDVNGILTTDPKVVQHASTISSISYNEAAELAYFGARVLHPSTMLPAIHHTIPIVVANSYDPHGAKTTIHTFIERSGLRAIAHKNHITTVNIQSYRMLNGYGFLNTIFAIFESFKTVVDLISTSEVSVSLTIDSTTHLKEIVKRLNEFARVDVKHHRSIIALVGHQVWQQADVIAKAFNAMSTIPIELISLGASETNLSVVVDSKFVNQAIKLLHSEFFEE